MALGAAEQGTSVILGRVVDAGTSAPVPGATVILLAPAAESGREDVIADSEGRFVFHSLVQGYYRLQAYKAGFVWAEYGQPWPEGPFQQLYVSPGQPITEATMRMWKPAAIGGIVLDEAGEPAVGVQVRALQVTIAGGRRLLRPASPAADSLTDDRGVYRIGNLSPGRYYLMAPSTVESAPISTAAAGLHVGEHVVASSGVRSAAPILLPDGRLEMTRSMYHPSSASLEGAAAITVASGEQRTGVDIRLTRTAAYSVSGLVLGSGGPAALMSVRLVADEVGAFQFDNGLEAAASTTGRDGRFTLLGVPPGQYLLRVLQVPRDGPALWAERSIRIGNAGLDDVLLSLREGARVSGRIAFEGAATPNSAAVSGLAVRLNPVDGREDSAFMRPPRANTDGTFSTLAYPPGRYFLGVVGLVPSARWQVRSVMLGERSLLDRPLELGGDDVTGVVITMTEELSGMAGTVALPPGGDRAAIVAVFPADVRTWIEDGMTPSRTAIALTDSEGRFAIRDLRPGSYLAVALRATSKPELQDPSVIDRLSRTATQVQVPDGGLASVLLTLGAGR
jgi:hypothetical protein